MPVTEQKRGVGFWPELSGFGLVHAQHSLLLEAREPERSSVAVLMPKHLACCLFNQQLSECESPLLTPGLPVAPAEVAAGGPWLSRQTLQCAAGEMQEGEIWALGAPATLLGKPARGAGKCV